MRTSPAPGVLGIFIGGRFVIFVPRSVALLSLPAVDGVDDPPDFVLFELRKARNGGNFCGEAFGLGQSARARRPGVAGLQVIGNRIVDIRVHALCVQMPAKTLALLAPDNEEMRDMIRCETGPTSDARIL